MKNIVKNFMVVMLSVGTLVSCSKDDGYINEEQTSTIGSILEDTAEKESITLYLVDRDETIIVENLNEAKHIINKTYDAKSDVVKNALDKITLLQEELTYSKHLNLNDSKVEQDYSKHITKKYEENSIYNRSTTGILWDGISSGFLSITTVPINLKASKRNKASSWNPISPGTVVLCDKTWFRGEKFILFSIIPGPTAVVPSSFNDKADSFF